MALLLLTTIILPPIRVTAEAPQDDLRHTSQLKALFLYNLAIFTNWPVDAFPEPSGPLILCVLGDEWVPRELEYQITGKSANGRGVRVRRSSLGPELRTCHILLVGSLQKKQLPEVLRVLRGASVLTVSDIVNFAEAGGAIQFSVEEDRVRFVVNLTAVEGARIKISSKLLQLSRMTIGEHRNGGG
jgi:uncharacterized protein DUF4154